MFDDLYFVDLAVVDLADVNRMSNDNLLLLVWQLIFVDRDFTISYLATDDTGEDVYLSLLSDWDLDAAFFSASNPCLRLKVDLKPFEPGMMLLCLDLEQILVLILVCSRSTADGTSAGLFL